MCTGAVHSWLGMLLLCNAWILVSDNAGSSSEPEILHAHRERESAFPVDRLCQLERPMLYPNREYRRKCVCVCSSAQLWARSWPCASVMSACATISGSKKAELQLSR